MRTQLRTQLIVLSLAVGVTALCCKSSSQIPDGAEGPDLAEADLGVADLEVPPPDLTGVMSNGLTVTTLSSGSFSLPVGIAVDPKGPNLWVTDFAGHTVQKLDAATGQVLLTLGVSGMPGLVDGGVGVARFRFPIGIRVDGEGTVYVGDSQNHAVRKIALLNGQLEVSTLAGGTQGKADGTGRAAQFNQPSGIEVDALRNVYVADTLNCALRQVSAAGVTQTLFSPGCSGVNILYFSRSLVRDRSGVFYASNPSDHRIMQITFTAGMGKAVVYAGSNNPVGMAGNRDGLAADARFNVPYGIAFDPQGNILVADQDNHHIRLVRVGASAAVETLAGTVLGSVDGDALLKARLNGPRGVAADASGVVYVADSGNRSIRRIR